MMSVIDAIMWCYGVSKAQAKKLAQEYSVERRKELLKMYAEHCRKSFYND